MKLWSDSFADLAAIPGEYAFAIIDAAQHVALSENRNPHLAWGEVPHGTQSFVLICHDKDVPSQGDDVNKEGREIPASLPRVDFFHWVLIDIPAAQREIGADSHSRGITPRGKPGPEISLAPDGMRHGINDYTGWFSGDPDMRGDYYGYDGPCPPWNDSIVHHYVFTLYALDVPRLLVDGKLSGQAVRLAMQRHILAQASLTGLYTLNPRLVT
ncbi:MAG: YbhB/YbcL family Raf kinase inhibitor-like protein [Burkholderiales bacterium]|jgi:Raf kinase inhibitor-like YbhB/YbcL family protein|nr:YbhB/YbcL family Raf kinase inhibitor-like protein [Burkholderiales bacterium]